MIVSARALYSAVLLAGSIVGNPAGHVAGNQIRVFGTGSNGKLQYWAWFSGAWNGPHEIGSATITGADPPPERYPHPKPPRQTRYWAGALR